MLILPKKIYLAAMKKQWKVSYVHKPGKLTLYEMPYQELVVYGKHYSKRAAIKLLIKWVKKKSKDHLTTLLIKLNRKIKANYKKLRIHSLKMEWGSYSFNKTLSLNYILIFLPPSLVKHLIIHELCHIRYPDHSPRFWKEVGKYDKYWKRNSKSLYDADIHIPKWVIF